MVTRKDVAKKAGVSTATVSRVTSGRGYVSEEAREKVQKAIGALNYIPNNIAKSLTQNRSNVVAVLVEDLTNPYYLQILDAMEREGAKYNLIISLFAVNKNDIDMVMTGLIENRVCAIIKLALFACNEKYISILEELEIYTVNIKPRNVGELRIHLNHALGIDSICAYLRDKGRRRLAYLAALGEELVRQDERLNAYLVSRKKYGLSEDDRLVVFANYPEERAFAVGYQSAKRLCERDVPFDSVLCMNDSVALGAMKYFQEKGFSIPAQVCVIGCDNIFMGQYVTPSLSTIDVETERQGIAYIRAIVRREGPRTEEIRATFIPRESIV